MNRRAALVLIAVLVAAGVPYLIRDNSYFIHVLIMLCYFAYLGTCWNILGGYAGQPSLGHAAFVGLGAYTSTVLFRDFGITPWIGMWVGALLATAFGLFEGYLTFRYRVRDIYFLLVTLAFAEILRVVTINIAAVGGASGISVTLQNDPLVFQFNTKLPYYYIMLVMLMGVLAVTYWFSRSKLGFYCVAIRENEDAAQALGVPIVRYKLFAVGLSAFQSALAGTFFAQYVTFIDPFSIMGMALSVEVLIYPIIGGPGTVFGPLIGAAVLVPIAEVTRSLSGGGPTGLHLMVYGGFLIFAIMFMPKGLVGLLQSPGRLRRSTARTAGDAKADPSLAAIAGGAKREGV